MAKQLAEITGIHPDPRAVLPCDDVVGETCVGVEVELENMPPDIFQKRFTYWKVTEDGSLRNGGAEFVFKQPLGGADIKKAMDEFSKTIRKLNPDHSDRTSIHVHVDVRELDIDQLRRFIMLYIVCEKPLYHVAGEERIDNIFCYSFQAAQAAISPLKRMLSGNGDDFHRGGGELSRYYGCNMQSVAGLGSVEFRLHAGTSDADDILSWVNTLLQLKEYAVANEFKPDELFADISLRGPEVFIEEVFPKTKGTMDYDNLAIDLFDGIRLAQDFLIDEKAANKLAKADFVKEGSVYEKYFMAKKGKSPYVKRDGDNNFAEYFGVDEDIIERIQAIGLDIQEVVDEIEMEGIA